jgi:hypothetical protein
MKYVKNAAIIISFLLLAYLILTATNQQNFAVAGMFAVPFLLLSFIVWKFKGPIKNFKIDLDDKSLSVNQKDQDEPGK